MQEVESKWLTSSAMSAKAERSKLRRKLQKSPTSPNFNNKSQQPPASNGGFLLPTTTYQPPAKNTTSEVRSPPKDQQVHRGRSRAASDPNRHGSLRRLCQIRDADDLASIAEAGSDTGVDSDPLPLIPEFAHLNLTIRRAPKAANTRAEVNHKPSHKPNYSTSSIPHIGRRYAKTPIRSIQEFEALSKKETEAAEKVTSIETMADSYRALIESNRSLLLTPGLPDDALPFRKNSQGGGHVRNTVLMASDDDKPITPPRAGHHTTKKRSPQRQADSPLSDTDTLVDAEEPAIYFKPTFSPDSTPVVQDFVTHGEPQPSPAVSTFSTLTTLSMDNNPSLSICLDLLSRELLSATAGSPLRPGSETSALQLQAMIEAYESLRDQAARCSIGNEQQAAAVVMFDTWLQALRAVQKKISIKEMPTRATVRRKPSRAALR